MNLFIFRRDLRIQDNTTLIKMFQELKEKIIVAFIFTPEQINQKKNNYFSHNSVQFMIESLHDLADEIKEYGGELYLFHDDNLDVIKKIHSQVKLENIGFNMDYTPYAKKRDKEIEDWAKDKDIKIFKEEDYILHPLLDGSTMNQTSKQAYKVFTPFRNYLLKNFKVREPNRFKSFDFKKEDKLKKISSYMAEKEIDKFYDENKDINVHGGRKNGLKILANIKKFDDYSKERDTLTYKTTFLGAHNHFSTVSIREVYHKIKDTLGKSSGIINELYWRDFYANITYFFPQVLKGQISGENKSFKEEYDDIKWSYNKKDFEKWTKGETGYPIIDAAMKQLNTTGFQHNRCRMITSSFLIKDLHLDWRMGEQYFAQKLVDYDPMNNSGGWLWSSGGGTDAQPWMRIFNPWTQAEKFDPDCDYIKKWLPELERIPSDDLLNWFKPEIHEKWLKEGIKYFKPMVNHDDERIETLKRYKKALK